jgi:hypothetical protein
MARGATEQCLVHELHQLERASAAKGGRLRCVLYDTAHNPEKIAAAGAASSRVNPSPISSLSLISRTSPHALKRNGAVSD